MRAFNLIFSARNSIIGIVSGVPILGFNTHCMRVHADVKRLPYTGMSAMLYIESIALLRIQ